MFWIPVFDSGTWILDFLSCFTVSKAQDSGFHNKKKWTICKVSIVLINFGFFQIIYMSVSHEYSKFASVTSFTDRASGCLYEL